MSTCWYPQQNGISLIQNSLNVLWILQFMSYLCFDLHVEVGMLTSPSRGIFTSLASSDTLDFSARWLSAFVSPELSYMREINCLSEVFMSCNDFLNCDSSYPGTSLAHGHVTMTRVCLIRHHGAVQCDHESSKNVQSEKMCNLYF